MMVVVRRVALGTADEFLMLNKEHIWPVVGEPGKAISEVMTSNGEV